MNQIKIKVNQVKIKIKIKEKLFKTSAYSSIPVIKYFPHSFS